MIEFVLPEATRRRHAMRLIVESESASPPPRAPTLALDLGDVGGPRVLVVSRGAPPFDVVTLVARGCEISFAQTLEDAANAMSAERFNLLVVDPHVDGECSGIRFVRALKQRHASVLELAEASPTSATRLRDSKFGPKRARRLLPTPTTTEYAIFLDASDWFLFDAARIPLVEAILACSPLR